MAARRQPTSHADNLMGCVTAAYSFVAFALAGVVIRGIDSTLGTVAVIIFVLITVWFGYYRAELRRQRRLNRGD